MICCESIISNDILLNAINNNNKISGGYNDQHMGVCEEITVPMCRNLPYNMTRMPNQFNHESQQDAALEVHQFWALVEINCSKDLKFFLCSIYTPICIENYVQPVKACKSVCERARDGCEKYMKKFGFEWPEHMNCNLFPESAKDVCMDPTEANNVESQQEEVETQQFNKPKSNPIITSYINIEQQQQKQKHQEERLEKNNNQVEIPSPFFKHNIDVNLSKMCLNPLIMITDYTDSRYNKVSTGNLLNCVRPCHDKYFTDFEYQFSYYWILFWSMLCFLSSFSTTITYTIETSRFKYPEKPILYLSICYLFVSIGFLLKYMIGHDRVSCELDGSIKQIISSSRNTTGTSTILCTIIFILIYYFSMASSVWWLIISLTWFLAAGLKWGIESISKYSYYFHLIAWLLPAFKTILILTLGYVDGDSLSGICYVGNTNLKSLKMFIIIPIFVYLTIGITFLLLGFISLFRLRNLIKQQQGQAKTNKLEKLMLRIGIFSILYTIPATCLISCYFYEQYYRIEWEQNYICNRQLAESGTASLSLNCVNTRKPEFLIFMLKYFSILIVGVTSGFWIWTTKTIISWKNFLLKCFHLNKQKNKQKISKRNSVIYFQASNDIDNNNKDENNVQINDEHNQMYQFNRINELNRHDIETNYCNIGTGSTIGMGTEDTIFTGSNSNSNVDGSSGGFLVGKTKSPTPRNNIITGSSLSSDSTISNSYTLMSSSNYPQFPLQTCHNNRAAYFYNENNLYNRDQTDNIRFMVPPVTKFPMPSPRLYKK